MKRLLKDPDSKINQKIDKLLLRSIKCFHLILQNEFELIIRLSSLERFGSLSRIKWNFIVPLSYFALSSIQCLITQELYIDFSTQKFVENYEIVNSNVISIYLGLRFYAGFKIFSGFCFLLYLLISQIDVQTASSWFAKLMQ